ncbi:MAG: type II toxin-antitoxin system PemK/MazF family toxin [Gemmatimonas sp.]|nr:type II toxin-antitoxin system PemK/MazF family toxin [Gemmatimonas sp.]
MTPTRGTVLLLDLDPTMGHEQRGLRPCIVVSDPEVAADQRFPLIGVVPVTRTAAVGALYPPLEAGSSGLTSRSYALIDHVRSVDKRRIRRSYGRIGNGEMAAIDEGLTLFLCLDGERRSSSGEADERGR